MSTHLADPTYVGDLGNGLSCRWSTKADQTRIGEFMGTVFRHSADEPLNIRTADEVRIFMSEGFPFMEAGDIAIVEDWNEPDHPVVACTCLWRHRWSYGGIEFGVGRPENVATDPAYRNRGLVRALFDMVHARSAAEGHLVQAITGIPYFYRQFGYEYVLDLGGRRQVAVAALPDTTGDEAAAYSLRLATRNDLSDLMMLYHQQRATSLIWHEASPAYWEYHIAGWDDPVVQEKGAASTGLFGRLHMIIDSNGKSCGYTWLAAKRWSEELRVYALELIPHIHWPTVMPALLRAFQQHGAALPIVSEDSAPFRKISLHFGRTHPAYEVLGTKLTAPVEPPYAWYLRVPDVPAFVRHIAPVLEDRLAASPLAGHTGTLKLDFYRGGMQLGFTQGRVVTVEPWRAPAYGDEAHAGCPSLLFLQLLFGYRSLAELRAVFPDVWASEEAILLINTLFPKQPSTVYSLSYT